MESNPRKHLEDLELSPVRTIRLKSKRPPPKIITTRDYKRMDVEKFRRDIETAPFHIANIFDDPDDHLWAWESIFRDILTNMRPGRKLKHETVRHHGLRMKYGSRWTGVTSFSSLGSLQSAPSCGQNTGMRSLPTWGAQKQHTFPKPLTRLSAVALTGTCSRRPPTPRSTKTLDP